VGSRISSSFHLLNPFTLTSLAAPDAALFELFDLINNTAAAGGIPAARVPLTML
jgi:hypothetical protein